MTMRRRRLSPTVARACVALSLSLALTGCSGSKALPTAPTPGTGGGERTLSSVQLTGSNAVNVGASSQLSASARWSDGTSEDVTSRATWQSPNTSVATVSTAGLLTGVAAGSVDVSAAFQGQTGRASVRVMAVDDIQAVTVTVVGIAINGSCDHDSLLETRRDGEFEFSFEVERSGTGVTPIMALSRRAMVEGDHPFSAYKLTFNRNVTRGEDFLLRFSGTEYDGLLGADPKFNGRRRASSFRYQAGQWAPAETQSISLDGGAQCGATVYFDITSQS
jgi:hypothetical protein